MLTAGRFHKPLYTTKVGQPGNLAQVLGFGKVATVSSHQHRVRRGQCHDVVERVEQVVVKLVGQFNGSGVGRRGGCLSDVELG